MWQLQCILLYDIYIPNDIFKHCDVENDLSYIKNQNSYWYYKSKNTDRWMVTTQLQNGLTKHRLLTNIFYLFHSNEVVCNSFIG